MARQLPPLNALRAFEAAARHLSFTRAANELAVTQAAVSHQIKGLEARLGANLFERQARGLKLTESGRELAPALTQALDAMETAVRRARAREASGAVKVTVLPSFALKWLLQRMGRFRALHPEIDVMVSANTRLADLERDEIDLGIRFGRGKYQGLEAELLMEDEVFPMASPRLLESGPPLREPADLARHTLLHDDVSRMDETPNWLRWLEAAGVSGVDPERGPGFSDSGMVLQAALDGYGVALGRHVLAADDLAAGRLVELFPGPRLPARFAYYVVASKANWERPKVVLLRQWLKEEAAAAVESLARGSQAGKA